MKPNIGAFGWLISLTRETFMLKSLYLNLCIWINMKWFLKQYNFNKKSCSSRCRGKWPRPGRLEAVPPFGQWSSFGNHLPRTINRASRGCKVWPQTLISSSVLVYVLICFLFCFTWPFLVQVIVIFILIFCCICELGGIHVKCKIIWFFSIWLT